MTLAPKNDDLAVNLREAEKLRERDISLTKQVNIE